jgi:acyl carrier protein
MPNDEIEPLIIECLTNLLGNEASAHNKDSVLLGQDAVIDSMALVNLVLDVEEAVRTRFGVSLTLADERAMSRTRSPFRTVGTLAEYVNLLRTGAAAS